LTLPVVTVFCIHDMKHLINGNETTMTRDEILALHRETLQNHANKMALLETIRNETGLNQEGLTAARQEQKETAERDTDAGLTSEINTSKDLRPLEDTVRGIIQVLTRHQFGYKGDGTRRDDGKLKSALNFFTVEENEAAENWAAGPKNGREWALTGKLSTDNWNPAE
jgi:hypothetical protein